MGFRQEWLYANANTKRRRDLWQKDGWQKYNTKPTLTKPDFSRGAIESAG
jgi:hypothetical protein